MKSIEKFLKEDWEIDENFEVTDPWKHIHEFAHRYEETDFSCAGNHDDHSISILQSMGYEETEIEDVIEWFKEEGGYCDDEVYLNVIMNYDS